MNLIRSVCIIAIIVIVILLVWVWSGIYNVAASKTSNKFSDWFLSSISDRSIKHHARGIAPVNIQDTSLQKEGYRHYSSLCIICHGAPGIEPSIIGKGLQPDPPDLSDEMKDWKPTEAFWIIKNGIKMTGMPSFGVKTSDKYIWSVVSFAVLLPGMSAQRFKTFLADTSSEIGK